MDEVDNGEQLPITAKDLYPAIGEIFAAKAEEFKQHGPQYSNFPLEVVAYRQTEDDILPIMFGEADAMRVFSITSDQQIPTYPFRRVDLELFIGGSPFAYDEDIPHLNETDLRIPFYSVLTGGEIDPVIIATDIFDDRYEEDPQRYMQAVIGHLEQPRYLSDSQANALVQAMTQQPIDNRSTIDYNRWN